MHLQGNRTPLGFALASPLRSLTSIMYFTEELIEQVPHYTHRWHEKDGSDTCSQLCTQFWEVQFMNTEYVNHLDYFLFTAHENDSSFMLPHLQLAYCPNLI
jgi:hypothetical protein